ncbi:MAG: SPOR domain-containing protein [Deltaproteobacteria bacterium]|nr:SPOR domain-containing protein [Deltaproteobacteria bacterium]
MSQQEPKARAKKQVTFTMGAARLLGYGLVMMAMMVWVFTLGVLVGRGDIHRLFQRYGFNKTDLAARLGMDTEKQVAAVLPGAAGPNQEEGIKPPPEAEKTKEIQAAAAPPTPAPAAQAADASASPSSPAAAKKTAAEKKADARKPKGLVPPKIEKDPGLAAKLSFQNSLDTPTRKPPRAAAKQEATVRIASATPAMPRLQGDAGQAATRDNKAGDATTTMPRLAGGSGTSAEKKPASSYQVRVASYRTPQEAEKAMADLKKKGFNVNLQQGKDRSGTTYVIRTGRFTSKTEAERAAKRLQDAKFSGQVQEAR